MLSKIERCERNAKREQVAILSKIFSVTEEDLLSLWLADKVYDVVKNEDVALKALSVTQEELKINPKRKKTRNNGNNLTNIQLFIVVHWVYANYCFLKYKWERITRVKKKVGELQTSLSKIETILKEDFHIS